MRTFLRACLFLVTIPLVGQNESQMALPDAPIADTSLRLDESVASSSRAAFVLPTFGVEPRGGLKWKTVDREFVLLNAVSTLAAALDVQTTVHGLRSSSQIAEINPLFGSRPTLGRILAIAGPVQIFTIFESYRTKRDAPRRGVWRAGPRVSIVAHSVAALNNFYATRLHAQ